eukprot:g5740.t1
MLRGFVVRLACSAVPLSEAAMPGTAAAAAAVPPGVGARGLDENRILPEDENEGYPFYDIDFDEEEDEDEDEYAYGMMRNHGAPAAKRKSKINISEAATELLPELKELKETLLKKEAEDVKENATLKALNKADDEAVERALAAEGKWIEANDAFVLAKATAEADAETARAEHDAAVRAMKSAKSFRDGYRQVLELVEQRKLDAKAKQWRKLASAMWSHLKDNTLENGQLAVKKVLGKLQGQPRHGLKKFLNENQMAHKAWGLLASYDVFGAGARVAGDDEDEDEVKEAQTEKAAAIVKDVARLVNVYQKNPKMELRFGAQSDVKLPINLSADTLEKFTKASAKLVATFTEQFGFPNGTFPPWTRGDRAGEKPWPVTSFAYLKTELSKQLREMWRVRKKSHRAHAALEKLRKTAKGKAAWDALVKAARALEVAAAKKAEQNEEDPFLNYMKIAPYHAAPERAPAMQMHMQGADKDKLEVNKDLFQATAKPKPKSKPKLSAKLAFKRATQKLMHLMREVAQHKQQNAATDEDEEGEEDDEEDENEAEDDEEEADDDEENEKRPPPLSDEQLRVLFTRGMDYKLFPGHSFAVQRVFAMQLTDNEKTKLIKDSRTDDGDDVAAGGDGGAAGGDAADAAADEKMSPGIIALIVIVSGVGVAGIAAIFIFCFCCREGSRGGNQYQGDEMDYGYGVEAGGDDYLYTDDELL